jgi:putative membrane protein
MNGFLLRFLICAVGLWLAEEILPGIRVDNVGSLVAAALLLGAINAFVRPVLVILTLPLTVVTLGLFLLVINAGMIGVVASILPGFHVAGFWSALSGGVIVSITGWVATWFIGPRGQVEIFVVRHR